MNCILESARLTVILFAGLTLSSGNFYGQLPQPDGGTLEQGTLPEHWLSQGAKCMEIPEWQVHEYNPDFFILRQSPCTDYEKPFIFLFFGKDKAMLVDTGSRNGNLVPYLQWAVKNWLARNNRASIPLVVTHTHAHGDHTFGDKALQALKDPAMPITFVAPELEATKQFFAINTWPTSTGKVDLGGRMIDIVPIPGHNSVSIAFYDRNTGILLSGDSLYPGRLYVQDFAAFQASTERLIQFTADKPITHILGNHIEQTNTPFLDYPVGTIYQPNEHVLALSRGTLLELEDALLSMHGTAKRLALRDFSVWPQGQAFTVPGERARAAQHMKEEKEKMWDHTTAR
jgi:glyoxylase-like metal-dependent hydrolase (beta-lactamase superfamily II)